MNNEVSNSQTEITNIEQCTRPSSSSCARRARTWTRSLMGIDHNFANSTFGSNLCLLILRNLARWVNFNVLLLKFNVRFTIVCVGVHAEWIQGENWVTNFRSENTRKTMGETASKNPPGFHPEFTLQKPLPEIRNYSILEQLIDGVCLASPRGHCGHFSWHRFFAESIYYFSSIIFIDYFTCPQTHIFHERVGSQNTRQKYSTQNNRQRSGVSI